MRIKDDIKNNADGAAKFLRSLANPNRLMILCLLAQGRLSVGEIEDALPLSQSALSQHLIKMKKDGILTSERDGVKIIYRLTHPLAKDVMQLLYKEYCN